MVLLVVESGASISDNLYKKDTLHILALGRMLHSNDFDGTRDVLTFA